MSSAVSHENTALSGSSSEANVNEDSDDGNASACDETSLDVSL